jgi:hypothetical protein
MLQRLGQPLCNDDEACPRFETHGYVFALFVAERASQKNASCTKKSSPPLTAAAL